jgi:hypothetical protein
MRVVYLPDDILLTVVARAKNQQRNRVILSRS